MNTTIDSLLDLRDALVARGELVAEALAECDTENDHFKSKLCEALKCIKRQKIGLVTARHYNRPLSPRRLLRKAHRTEARINEIDRLIGQRTE